MNDLMIINDEAPALPAVVSVEEVAGCNLLAAQVQSHLAAAWHKAVILGYKLSIIKAKCKHGEFGKLFSVINANHDSHFHFGRRQAEKYMSLYTACATRAKELKESERLSALLGYTTGEMDGSIDVQAKVEELGGMLSELTGGATSMRQALFAFMNEEDKEEAEAPAGGMKRAKSKLIPAPEKTPEQLEAEAAAQAWLDAVAAIGGVRVLADELYERLEASQRAAVRAQLVEYLEQMEAWERKPLRRRLTIDH